MSSSLIIFTLWRQVVLYLQQDQQSLLEIPRWQLPVQPRYFIRLAEATSIISEPWLPAQCLTSYLRLILQKTGGIAPISGSPQEKICLVIKSCVYINDHHRVSKFDNTDNKNALTRKSRSILRLKLSWYILCLGWRWPRVGWRDDPQRDLVRRTSTSWQLCDSERAVQGSCY